MVDFKMPNAVEAEIGLLGTILLYPDTAKVAYEQGLKEEEFFSDANALIYRSIIELYQRKQGYDFASLYTYLTDTNRIDKIGGMPYLQQLPQAAITAANAENYIKLIKEKAVIRRIIEESKLIVEEGMNGQPDLDSYLDETERRILNISRNRRTTDFRDSKELVRDVLNNIQMMSDNRTDVTGIKTGFKDLDHTTHGFQRGDLIILAARPSMGKTAVSLNLALKVSQYQPDQAVAIFSLEMSAEQLMMRLLSAQSRLPGDKLKTGYLTKAEFQQLNEAASVLSRTKIYIDDAADTKTSDIFGKCRSLQSEHGLSLVLIDYIQLINSSSKSRDGNRQQEVSEISRNLKALARELKVPVIALSQLSRSVEQRDGKRPMLSDLRESGAIEQDADVVMLLYRDGYYNEAVKLEAEKTGQEELEINVAKHRNGATRKVTVAFEAKTNAILNIERNQVIVEG